jgi:hypothetical protein
MVSDSEIEAGLRVLPERTRLHLLEPVDQVQRSHAAALLDRLLQLRHHHLGVIGALHLAAYPKPRVPSGIPSISSMIAATIGRSCAG